MLMSKVSMSFALLVTDGWGQEQLIPASELWFYALIRFGSCWLAMAMRELRNRVFK